MGMPCIMEPYDFDTGATGQHGPGASNRVGVKRLAFQGAEHKVIISLRYS
jgi:hypothetical protein